MDIDLFVSRYDRMIGLARYTVCLQNNLGETGIGFRNVYPEIPFPLPLAHTIFRPLGFGIRDFFNIYPISASFRSEAIKHFTHQMMAFMLSLQNHLGKVIITVHDIVPYMMRDDPEQNVYGRFYDRLVDNRAMQNLRKADRLIAISTYTKEMLIKHLKCDPEKIEVVLYGVDHELFQPVSVPESFYNQYGLDPHNKHLLYVGSENPRKNLTTLIQALRIVKSSISNVKLIKVGTPAYLKHFKALLNEINDLQLQEDVIFIDHPPQEDLVKLYAMADAFVFPSLFEGFGMPPLEAMACGAPVISSNAASLPEVVGDAAVSLDPLDVQQWACAIIDVLSDQQMNDSLRTKSLARAAQFSWERTARETIAVYEKVLGEKLT